MSIHLKSALHLFAALLLISACGQQTPTPDAPTEPVAVATVTPAPTSTPTYTPMPNATNTNAPIVTMPTPDYTITPMPASDIPLSPNGPWLIFEASIDDQIGSYLWGINADGSGLSQLSDDFILVYASQPVDSLDDGGKIAYVTLSDLYQNADLALKIMTLPSREVETITLLNDQNEDGHYVSEWDIAYAMNQGGGLVWSPDGRYLAFIGVMDGTSVDVYIYDIETKGIRRLTSGQHHACVLSWSPNGDYVLHKGYEFSNMAGPVFSGAWAARADGLGSVPLFDETAPGGFDTDFEGWITPYLVAVSNRASYSPYENASSNLRTVNLFSGESQVVYEGVFFDAAYAPEYDIWLFSNREHIDGEFETSLNMFQNNEAVELSGHDIYQLDWWPLYEFFTGRSWGGDHIVISLSGEISAMPLDTHNDNLGAPEIYVSPNQRTWAWLSFEYYSSESRLWIGAPMQQPTAIQNWQSLEAMRGAITGRITWSPDSQRLFMFSSEGIWIAEQPEFNPLLITADIFWRNTSFETNYPEWMPQNK